MNAENLKHSAIFLSLKKDEKAQEAAVSLGKLEEWKTVKRFVMELKQLLLETAFETDSLKEMQKFKNLIRGMESIVLLPRLVDLVKSEEKKEKTKKKVDEEEAKRRKFAPGAFVRDTIDKFKK